MKRSVVTARGEGLRNEKSTRAGPVLPHTHTETLLRMEAGELPLPPHPLPSPSLFEGDM